MTARYRARGRSDGDVASRAVDREGQIEPARRAGSSAGPRPPTRVATPGTALSREVRSSTNWRFAAGVGYRARGSTTCAATMLDVR